MARGECILCLLVFVVLATYVVVMLALTSVTFGMDDVLRLLENKEVAVNVALVVIGVNMMLLSFCRYGRRRCPQETPSIYEDVGGGVILDLDRVATVMASRHFPNNTRRLRFNWSSVTIVCDQLRYTGGPQCFKSSSRVLYKKTYTNSTGEPQTHRVSLARTTVSVFELSILRTFVCSRTLYLNFASMQSASGADLDLEIARQLNNQKGLLRKAEHTLTWEVNTEVTVPANTKVTVQLEAREETYDGQFEMLTTISGNVIICQGDTRMCALSLLQDLTSVIMNTGLSVDEENRLTYLVKGWCKYTLVLGHDVNKIEKPLTPGQDQNE